MDCAITADGKWAISAAWDQTLKIWDLVQGVECFTLTGHTEHINAVAITKDGSRAVSGTNQGEIKIWDLERRIVLFSWRGHQKAINALLLLPGDHLVLSIADDETIRGWEIATGEARFVLSLNNEPQPATTDEIERLRLRQQHNMRMTTIAVLPSAGTQVITGGWNHTLYLWDLESQAEVGMLHGCTSGITDVVVSPDGRFVLTTGGLPHISSDNMIRVWDLTQRKEIAHFTAEAPLTACAFSPDGHTIVAGDDQGNLHYLRLENG
jgi:WD40 repeat protein